MGAGILIFQVVILIRRQIQVAGEHAVSRVAFGYPWERVLGEQRLSHIAEHC